MQGRVSAEGRTTDWLLMLLFPEQAQLDRDPVCWRAACVGRGDLQATFGFKGFEEVRRLGLRRETEAAVRAAAAPAANTSGALTRCRRLPPVISPGLV